ncbi:hypothetical protein [Streptomyces sp. NEAU-NA10]|uniref:hypothetical protein n=1 Tax=Streptomyces sp. NEAU-NA10 TaxID=3416050 RepID=UPI003CC649A4
MTNENESPNRSESDLESLAEYFQSASLADMESSEVEVEPSRYPMVSRSIRMEQAMMSEIRKVAAQRGVPVTQLMRQWVREGLERAKSETKENLSLSQAAEVTATPHDIPRIGVHALYANLSLARSYTVGLIKHHEESGRDAVVGRRIERRVLQERAMRDPHSSETEALDPTKRERSK